MDSELKISRPCDGDVLNRQDGQESQGSLTVVVQGVAPPGTEVFVNDRLARRDGQAFSCETPLCRRRNRIVVRSGSDEREIQVCWNKGSRKRYRFSTDDNILFLRDLGLEPDTYPSLFDHPYLGFWREMHRAYGAKIHVNIYYQTEGFDLTQMPDKWRDEWQENASWLHLSFHALQDQPQRPYRNATYTQMAHDYDLVCGHIRRFAGNEALSMTTTVHWAECTKEAAIALRDRGIEQLIGLFDWEGAPGTTGYYLTDEQQRHCSERGVWHDRETGITFINCAAVVNALEVEQIAPHLQRRSASPHAGELLELLIHEQYFRKELPHYQPSVQEKVRAALEWVTTHGYEPVFWSDGFLGTPE